MPANDVFELTVDMTHNGQNLANVHHFTQIGGDGTGTWQDALKQIWIDSYRAALKAMMVTAVNIVQIKVRRLFPTQTQSTTTAIGEAGDIIGVGLPTHAAVLLRQRGFPTGRKGTGGVKICGVPIGAQTAGRLSSAAAALVKTYGDVSESDITDGGSNYTMRAGVLSNVDNVLRKIQKSIVTPRIVTVHSRQVNVGD